MAMLINQMVSLRNEGSGEPQKWEEWSFGE